MSLTADDGEGRGSRVTAEGCGWARVTNHRGGRAGRVDCVGRLLWIETEPETRATQPREAAAGGT